MTTKMPLIPVSAPPSAYIFRFQVILMSGPMTDDFISRQPTPPSRVIEVTGNHSLADLHQAIFQAFDREDPHGYQFELNGEKPMDRKAQHYGICDGDDAMDGMETKNAATAIIDELPLTVGQSMFYWFDFSDDWWHKVTLLGMAPTAKEEKYPRIAEGSGESPPQYADWKTEEEKQWNLEDSTEQRGFSEPRARKKKF